MDTCFRRYDSLKKVQESIKVGRRTALLLCLPSSLLALDPSLRCRLGRFRLLPRSRFLRSLADEFPEPVHGVLAVSLLGPKLAGLDDEDAVLVYSSSGQADQAR